MHKKIPTPLKTKNVEQHYLQFLLHISKPFLKEAAEHGLFTADNGLVLEVAFPVSSIGLFLLFYCFI